MRTVARAELASAKALGLLSIGQAAAQSGVSAKMIRHYESLGLLPKAQRTVADYRLYGESELHVLRFIKRARNLGFDTQEIATLLNLWRDQRRPSREVKRLVIRNIAALDRKIEELHVMRAALMELAQHCHGDERPHCPILNDLAGPPFATAARS